MIEKSLDCHSHGAIAQSDIRQFYDSLSLVLVYHWLIEHSVPEVLAGSILRYQRLASARIQVGAATAYIPHRTIDCLTGSRTAGFVARIPVEHMVVKRHLHWEQWGFGTPYVVLSMATYVDNLFVAGKSSMAASQILDDAEQYLLQKWNLAIKPSSRAVMPTSGSDDTSVSNAAKWPVVSHMTALGHLLSADGCFAQCFQHTLQALWRAFFANCGPRHNLPSRRRLQLLQRAVLPILQLRVTRWPFQLHRARWLDLVQRRMIALCLGLRLEQDEAVETFVRRRGRAAGREQAKLGRWSTLWAKAVIGWDNHLQRERNSKTWSAQLRLLSTPADLQQRRCVLGRPQTRAQSGFIRTRWFEAVEAAKEWVDDE